MSSTAPTYEQCVIEMASKGHVINEEEYLNTCTKLNQKPRYDSCLIYDKIQTQTITKEDLEELISESLPSSIRDRVRRRTLVSKTREHLTPEGHQPKAPDFNDRVTPHRSPSGEQMNGRGSLAHKHSTKTQRRNMRNEIQEAIDFVAENYNKDVIEINVDKIALKQVINKLLLQESINRDWLIKVKEMCNG